MRRFWMLLLAVVVVAAFLAVPAMAEETTHLHGSCTDGAACTACGQDHTVWTVLPSGTQTLTGGNYYLSAETAASVTVTEGTVTICLNGNTWTGYEGDRPLYVTGGTVNIVDCSDQSARSETDTTPVSAGQIVGVDLTKGGTVTNVYGGAVRMKENASAVVNFYNGTITGGIAIRGGNVCIEKGSFNMYGGVIADGIAQNAGGNIWFGASTLTIDGENALVVGGQTRGVKLDLDEDTSNQSPNGGNIYVSSGTMYLKNGVIRDGFAANGGTAGNLRLAGTFYMSGGLITNGSTGNKSGVVTFSGGTSNIQAVSTTLHLSGGRIDGYAEVYSGNVNLSGSIQVYAQDDDGYLVSGLGLGYKAGSRDVKVKIAAALNEDARVALGKEEGTVVLDKVSDATQWAQYVQYVREGKITGHSNYDLAFQSVEGVEAIYIHKGSSRDIVYHCYCGFVNGKHDAGCEEFCGGYDVSWQPWDGSTNLTFGSDPNGATYRYYLTRDFTRTDQVAIGYYTYSDGANAAKDVNCTVALDMNGHNLSGNADRLLQVRAGTDFIMCNSKATGGELRNRSASATSGNLGVMQCLGYKNTISMMRGVTMIYEDNGKSEYKNNDDVNIYKTTEAVLAVSCTFNMYGGRIEGSPTYAYITNGGAVTVNGGTNTSTTLAEAPYTYKGVFNMYEDAVIVGGYASGLGGAIRVNCGEFNCYGGTITGATVPEGTTGLVSPIYVYKGSFTAKKGASGKVATISAGSFVAKGGVFYLSTDAQVLLEEGTVVNGGSATTGGIAYVAAGSFIADASVLNGGVTTATAKNTAYGGAIYQAAGTVIIRNGSVINGGQAPDGGNVAIAGGSFTLDGSTVSNGFTPRVNDTTYKNDKNETKSNNDGWGGRGANFYVGAGTLTIQNDSTVSGGYASQYDSMGDGGSYYGGSAVYLDTDATVIVDHSRLEGYIGARCYKRSGTILNHGGTLTIRNGSYITGTWASCDSSVLWNAGGTCTLIDSTLDASNLEKTTMAQMTYGGAVRNAKAGTCSTAATFNMESGTIIGFKTSSTNGGAAVYNNATFNMKGGTIQGTATTSNGIGGTVANGGNTFNMTGGTIQGGEAYKGGNVYVKSGTFNLYNGTITGGKATNGGNIYIGSGTFNAIPDPKGEAEGAQRLISGGKCETTKEHASGGNIAINSGTLNLRGTTVSDGYASFNGALPNKADGTADKRYAYGGNIWINTNVTATIADNCLITGGTVDSKNHGENSWAPGGNIYTAGNSTITIANSRITDGQKLSTENNTGVDGKNIYVNYGCQFTLESGTVVSNTSTANQQENILVQGGTLTIKDGVTITTADGVVGRNIMTNSSAISGRTDEAKAGQLRQNPVINMEGGVISGGNFEGNGGNVYLEYWAEFNMTGGEIRDGRAVSGGANIFLPASTSTTYLDNYKKNIDGNATLADIGAKVVVSGDAKVIGGTITKSSSNGGSIWIGGNSNLTVEGDAEVYGGESKNCGGNIYTNGYLTIGGNARVYDGQAKDIKSYPNIFVVGGFLTLQDNAQVAGGIGITQTGDTPRPVTLKGSPVVDKALTSEDEQIANRDMSLQGGCYLVIEDLTAEAQIDFVFSYTYSYTDKDADGKEITVTKDSFQVDEATDGYIVCTNVGASNVSGLGYETTDYYMMTDGTQLLVVPKAKLENAVSVDGSVVYYTLEAAVAKAQAGSLLRLHTDCTASEAVTLPENAWLDLNGNTFNGDLVATGTLKLADSAAVNYTYEEGVNGVITGSITGTVARSFTTNDVRDQFGDHNYRFLVLQTKDALGNVIYTSHRIYLAVKSVVLSPAKPAMNYRTALRCDDMVAQYISGYGIIATADMEDAKPVSSQYNTKLVGGNSAANERITQLNNILMPEQDMATQILHAETDIIACAYITLTDLTGGEITSAAVTKSLKTVVQAVDKMTDVNPLHQTYLADMYANYTELMTREGWGLTTIPTYTPSTEE